MYQSLLARQPITQLTRPVVYALAGSILLHGIALAFASLGLLTGLDVEPPVATEPALNLVLVQRVVPEAVVPVSVESPAAVPAVKPSKAAEQDNLEQAQVADNRPARVVTSAAKSAVEGDISQPTTKQAPTLNLRRPTDWSALATQSPEELANLAFKKSTREAIAKRKQERARSQALSRSQIERLGLPEDAYRRRTDTGEEVKTAKGCFVKRAENGPNGQAERWWRTACRDSSKPDWQREVLTFGPDHRPLPNVPQTPPEP